VEEVSLAYQKEEKKEGKEEPLGKRGFYCSL
jgi:hypothetical protein